VPYRYKFGGDSPRSLPEFGIEVVSPGETVETVQELEHPDFKLLAEKKGKSEPVPAEPVAEPVQGKE